MRSSAWLLALAPSSLLVLAPACRSTLDSVPDSPALSEPGFDPFGQSGAWRVGDRARLLLRVEDAKGREDYQVLFEMGSPGDPQRVLGKSMTSTVTVNDVKYRMTSLLMPVETTVRALEGGAVTRAQSDLPITFLALGFVDFCAQLARWGELEEGATPAPDELRAFAQGIHVLPGLLQLVAQNPATEPLLWRVIDKPSWFSVLRHGVKLNLDIDERLPHRAWFELPAPLDAEGPLAGWVLPVGINVNGKRALDLELSVTTPRPPLHLTGGVIAIEGVHPRRPERRFQLRLEGAQLGDGLPQFITISTP